MRRKIFKALKTVLDPELGINIVDLGLVYEVKEKDDVVDVLLTLTTPGCPMGPFFETQIKEAIKGAKEVRVTITFDPPWTSDRMAPFARAALGLK